MSNKEVRVKLGLDIAQFQSHLSSASNSFRDFATSVATGVAGAVSFFNDLINIIAHLPDAIGNITNAIKGLFEGVMEDEGIRRTFRLITGDAQQAEQMFSELDKTVLATGVSMTDLAAGGRQIALALKAADGAVDLDKWKRLTLQSQELALVTGASVDQAATAISKFIAGQPELLMRLLGTNKDALKSLSADTQAFLAGAQAASDTALGAVTHIAEGEKATAEDAQAALDEVMGAIGVTDKALEEFANSTEGKFARLNEKWAFFVDSFAESLLPTLNKALEKLIQFMEDHEDEIIKFVDALADISIEGFEELLKLLDNPKNAEDFFDALEGGARGLQSIGGVIADVANAIKQLNEFMASPAGQLLQGVLKGSGGGIALAESYKAKQGDSAIGSAVAQSGSIPEVLSNLPSAGQFGQALAQSLNVNVTLTVDDEGQYKVKQIAQQAAAGAVKQMNDAIKTNQGGAQ